MPLNKLSFFAVESLYLCCNLKKLWAWPYQSDWSKMRISWQAVHSRNFSIIVADWRDIVGYPIQCGCLSRRAHYGFCCVGVRTSFCVFYVRKQFLRPIVACNYYWDILCSSINLRNSYVNNWGWWTKFYFLSVRCSMLSYCTVACYSQPVAVGWKIIVVLVWLRQMVIKISSRVSASLVL